MACNNNSSINTEKAIATLEHEEMEEAHSEEEVGLTNIQMEKIGLELGTFEEKNLNSSIKVNGQLSLPPHNKADVSALVSGRISKIAVRPGQYVKKGTILATLQNPIFIEWQQSYLEAKGSLLYLDKEWERLQDLVKKEIAPQKKLDKIISERVIIQAKLKGLAAKMTLLGLAIPTEILQNSVEIRSPMKGYIDNIKINTGVSVQAAQGLFEIVDNQHLHLDLKVFEKHLPYLEIGQEIQFALQSEPSNRMKAEIFALGKSLDPSRQTVEIHAEIKQNNTNLLPGMFVEARILLAHKTVAALPNEAITIDKGLNYIFVQEEVHGDETHFLKIPVLKGNSDLGYTEVTVLEELAPHSKIVTKGAYFLMAQSKKGEEGAGHHH